MMNQTIPQNAMSAMYFVDGADENQLRAMVAAKNPFSVFALSRLQSMRDAKMKAQAGQPEPPPLSQEIPQQLDQLSRPQQHQQAMQQQPPMGLASIGGAPTGAGGGMVAFKDGGGIRRFAEPNGNQLVGPSSLMGLELGQDTEVPPLVRPTPEQVDEILKNMRSQGKSVGLSTVLDAQAGKYPIITAAPAATPVTGTSTFPGRSTVEGAPVATVAPNQAATSQTGKDGSDLGIKRAGGFNLPSLKDINLAQDEKRTALKNAESGLQGAYGFDKAGYESVIGDTTKNVENNFKNLKDKFADPYSGLMKKVDESGKEIETSKSNAPYEAMLEAAAALMSNKSPNLLAAIGSAIPAGTKKYAELQSDIKKSQAANLQVQATLSAAQDARSRGLYDQANKIEDTARSQRMFAYNAEADAKARIFGARTEMDLKKAGYSGEALDFRVKMATAQAQIIQATKPEAHVQLAMALASNPKLANFMQSQDQVSRAAKVSEAAVARIQTEKNLMIKNALTNMADAAEMQRIESLYSRDKVAKMVSDEVNAVLTQTQTTFDQEQQKRLAPLSVKGS